MSLFDHVQLHQFSSPETMARTMADRWLDPSAPLFRHVALSGGRIARTFLAAAADLASRNPLMVHRLRQTHFFWADERCVPPDHPDSNYHLANESLLEPLDIPPGLVHRLQGELEPRLAVQNANAEILSTLPLNSAGLPVFDLVFLGMGEDGHVASLFPGGPESTSSPESPYATIAGPKPPNPRLTLTYPILAAAANAWVLVSGTGKEAALRNSLKDRALTPLSRLLQSRSSTVLAVDRIILNDSRHGGVETAGK